MVDIATDPICAEALRLAGDGGGDSAVARLVELTGTDREALLAARNAFARRLHSHADDYAATGALQLLNRAIAAYGWQDPYDWRGRLGNRLLKP
jgi:hypothetical protein